MKVIIAVLVVLLALLQYKLWVGEGSFAEAWRLRKAIEVQAYENSVLHERNQALAAEVKDLKEGRDAIEERARSELGMIKKDETFYQIIEN